MRDSPAVIDTNTIDPLIIIVRGKRMVLDADLARLYGVTTKALNQAVNRNIDRFLDDFAFRITRLEKMELVTNCDRSGIGTSRARCLPAPFG